MAAEEMSFSQIRVYSLSGTERRAHLEEQDDTNEFLKGMAIDSAKWPDKSKSFDLAPTGADSCSRHSLGSRWTAYRTAFSSGLADSDIRVNPRGSAPGNYPSGGFVPD